MKVFESHGFDGRYNELGSVCSTVLSHYGTGGGSIPIVLKEVTEDESVSHKFLAGGVSGTLDSHYYKGTGEREGTEREYLAISIGNGQMNNISMKEVANTLDTLDDIQKVMTEGDKMDRKYIVRRLTPLECCRLQGFPDGWDDDVGGSDTAKYKMWGNGMALPNMFFVLSRIKEYEDRLSEQHDY